MHSNTIIELGTGVGLVSLVLARMMTSIGIAQDLAIIATDVDEMVLEQLEGNIKLSTHFFYCPKHQTFKPFRNVDQFEKSIIASKLDWEISSLSPPARDLLSGINLGKEVGEQREPRSIDEWERLVLPKGQRARLILGADIVHALSHPLVDRCLL